MIELQYNKANFKKDNFAETIKLPKQNNSDCSILYKENEVDISINLSGIEKEDINVSLLGKLLTIKIKPQKTVPNKNFKKTINLDNYMKKININTNSDLDEENISTSFVDGLLTIKIPKIKHKEKLIHIK